MANSHTCIVEADGENAELSRFYNAMLLIGGDLRELLSPVSNEVLKEFTLSPSGQRPVEVTFECYGRLPDELVCKVSQLFPTLVFALRFVDEMLCHVGFVIYRDGQFVTSAINRNVYRGGDEDFDVEMAEALHPEAATIDGYEAVDWAERLHEALNVVPRETAFELGLGGELLELKNFADRVEELGPEYEHATTPLGEQRHFLEELCAQASLLEALAACRMAVREALKSQGTPPP